MKHIWVLPAICFIFAACSESPPDSKVKEGVNAPPCETVIKSGLLEGTYHDAGTGAPAALIVPGSGPTDRNGDSPTGLKSATYKHLAWQLGARGVSSVRVDKRGMFGSLAAGDGNKVSVDIYARDYRAWIDRIKAETGLSCIYLIGHSEAALMVSAAAVDRADVCGLILIAGVGRPFGDVLREQLSANPANIFLMKDAVSAIESLERGEPVDVSDFHPALKNLFYPDVQDFLISLMATDPAKMAGQADKPTLVIQGETDIQTFREDAEALAAASGGKLVLIEGVNHVLKAAPKGRAANLATYKNPDLPVAEEVITAIVEFIENE